MNSIEFRECGEVIKKWGKEKIIVNNHYYCGKILCINAGRKFSMHFHMKKDETWYVSQGNLILRWIDTESSIQHEKKINKNDVIRIRPGIPHQLEACEDSEIFEVSTHHEDGDSYRVQPGDSQS